MQMKDSNTYDGETWCGYECECGNVEIETFKADIKNKEYDLIDNNNNFQCTKCNGFIVKNHSNATYVCTECKHVICEEVLFMIACEKIKSGGI